MIQFSNRFLPTLLASSLSCVLLTACGVNDKPTLPDNAKIDDKSKVETVGDSTSKTDNSKTDNSKTDNSKTDDSKTDDSKTDDSKTDDSKTDDSKTDDSKTDDSKTDITINGLSANPNTVIYEDGTDTKCSSYYDKTDEKCGAITYRLSSDNLEVLTKFTKDNPATVDYALTSSTGNIEDILKNPADKTGTIKLYADDNATADNNPLMPVITIPLKTDNKATGDRVVTLTLSNPHNPVGKASLGPLHSATFTIKDPQGEPTGGSTGGTTDTDGSTKPKQEPTTAINKKATGNDTGITFTANNLKGNETSCTSLPMSKRDCATGRDATNNDNSDGYAGFSFTKIDSTGKDLPNTATDWSCVRDNVTGLVWERKTYVKEEANKDYRDVKWSYAYYDSKQEFGVKENLNDSDFSPICDKEGTKTNCTTEAYAKTVNAKALCGISNWRLPTKVELFNLTNLNGKNTAETIHADWFFSNDKEFPIYYWTSSIAAKSKYGDPFEYDAIWQVSPNAEFATSKTTSKWGSAPTNGVILVSDGK